MKRGSDWRFGLCGGGPRSRTSGRSLLRRRREHVVLKAWTRAEFFGEKLKASFAFCRAASY